MSGISVHPNAPFSRMKKNMIEGFTAGDVFDQVLRMPKPNIVPTKAVPGKSSGVTNTNSGSCPPPVVPTAAPTGTATTISPYTAPPFLKKLIQEEKQSVESLLRTAAKIGPMANTVVETEDASDAAFVSKIPAPIPTYGSTIQGFTFILFFWSCISLAIVSSIYINQTTGNTLNAVGTFIGLIILLVMAFGFIKRYG
jgi:hypothetical protein